MGLLYLLPFYSVNTVKGKTCVSSNNCMKRVTVQYELSVRTE